MEFNVSVKVNPISLIVKALSLFNRNPIRTRFTYIWSQITLFGFLILANIISKEDPVLMGLITLGFLAWSMFVDYKRVIAIGINPWWITLRIVPVISLVFLMFLCFAKGPDYLEQAKAKVDELRKNSDGDGYPSGETVTQ